MRDKIYIIVGQCGEYEDHQSWIVTTSDSQEKAIQIIENIKKNPKLDPYYQTDSFTGTNYTIEERKVE